MNSNIIRKFLELSLEKARTALTEGNYPIGSVIVDAKETIVAAEYNKCTTLEDISAHAEILCIRAGGITKLASDSPGEYYLFSSLEPCYGCSFFLARTNIKAIYSALKDPHKGGISKLKEQEMFTSFFMNIELHEEPFEDLKTESLKLMQTYFLNRGRLDAAAAYGFVPPQVMFPSSKKTI
jgi:tRNA(adenine34) deaminase